MSIPEIIVVGLLVVMLVLLIRAAYVLGRNPYQQIKEHEDLVGRFPTNWTHAEKLRAMNLNGISPTQPGRIWVYVVAAVCFVVLMFVYNQG